MVIQLLALGYGFYSKTKCLEEAQAKVFKSFYIIYFGEHSRKLVF